MRLSHEGGDAVCSFGLISLMPFEAALFIAFFILLATVIGILIFVGSRRLAAKEEELRRIASARGWQFESKLEKGTACIAGPDQPTA